MWLIFVFSYLFEGGYLQKYLGLTGSRRGVLCHKAAIVHHYASIKFHI